MRIIDKNTDFYDFYQNIYKDETTVFDRRDSYDLSKEEFAHGFLLDYPSGKYKVDEKWESERTKFILLQVCNTFWLFKMFITEVASLPFLIYSIEDYELSLIDKWQDYDLPSVVIELSEVKFNWNIFSWNNGTIDEKKIDAMKQAIHTNDFHGWRAKNTFNKFRYLVGNEMVEKHIPILKNIGIAALVNPEDIYFALDEYFSKKITDGERIESVGITDKERVVNHGFSDKTSFRGKNK